MGPFLNVDGHRPRRRVLLVGRADALVGAAPSARGRVVDGLRRLVVILLLPVVTTSGCQVVTMHGAAGIPVVMVMVGMVMMVEV